MSQQTAAKQIGELRAAGFVSRTRIGRNTYCEFSEPLMRVCIEVKDNETRHFRLFVEFLHHWFTNRELERRQAAFRQDELLSASDCHSLLLAASSARGIGDYAAAGRYLERIAELQPDNRELWIERIRLHIDEGAFDAASESAARIEALPGGSLPGRLLAAQVAAVTDPLPAALETLPAVLDPEDFESDEERHVEATVGILTISLRNFGPRYLPQGLAKLRDLLTDRLEGGVVGRILTDFLKANVDDGLTGSLADWERALDSLSASLTNLPDCRIPVEMLQVAVRYTKTGDKRHLLSLPLEQRRLLESVLPPTAGECTDRA